MKKFFYVLLSLALIFNSSFFAFGCDKGGQDQGLVVYTSFYTLYDFASKIAQDKAKIYNIMSGGGDAHSWEPSAKDIVKLNKADIFIYNGLGLEHWADKVLNSIEKDVLIVRVSDGIEALEDEHDDYHESGDPHIWLSPKNAKIILKNIKDTFSQADPQNAQFYKDNYERYADLCDELDSSFEDELSGFEKRDIAVMKNAFSYLCHEYDLNQVALSRSHESDPNNIEMKDFIKYIIDQNVKVVFYEQASLDLAKAVKDEVSKTKKGLEIELDVLNSLEVLSEQDLKNGDDYFKIMRKNLDSIKKALQKQNGTA